MVAKIKGDVAWPENDDKPACQQVPDATVKTGEPGCGGDSQR